MPQFSRRSPYQTNPDLFTIPFNPNSKVLLDMSKSFRNKGQGPIYRKEVHCSLSLASLRIHLYWARSLCLASCFLFIAAHRLPAPIVEPEEKPTPAPEQSKALRPKMKRPTESAPSEEKAPAKSETRTKPAPPTASLGPARFDGTWIGKINQGLLG